MKNEQLREVAYRIILQARFGAGREVFAALDAEGIPYAVHKGAMLSQTLYGNPAVRQSGDIDLLLAREDGAQIKEIFKAAGFLQGRVVEDRIEPYSRAQLIFQASQSHQLAPFVKATGHKLCPFVEYDCNMDIFWGEAQQRTDMTDFLTHTVRAELFGVPLRQLTPEAEFIALCMHHYKDFNSIYLLWTRGLERRKLEEIARYAEVVPMEFSWLLALCERYHAGDYVCCCAHLAGCVCPGERLHAIERALITPEAEELFDSFGLCKEERKCWNVPVEQRIGRELHAVMEPLLDENDKNKIKMNQKMM